MNHSRFRSARMHCAALMLSLFSAPPHAQSTQAGTQPAKAAQPLTFTVTYDGTITKSFTGRVYLMFSSFNQEPRFGPRWSGTEPFFSMDVTDWKPDSPLTFDDRALAFPERLSAVPENDYAVQAVMRRNLDSPSIGDAPGTAYSKILR